MSTDTILFQAMNNHSEDCGTPPRFTNRDGKNLYHGFYQNAHGEQFVFVYDYDKKTGVMYSGDCDWKSEMRVFEVSPADIVKTVKKNAIALDVEVTLDDAGIVAEVTAQHVPLPNGNFVVVPGWSISKHELTWLQACWCAAHHM